MGKELVKKLRGSNPFQRSIEHFQWYGSIISPFNNTSTHDFTCDDLKEIIYNGISDDLAGYFPKHDRESAGVCLLNDGRYIVWESFEGATGHGFYEDAYGGNVNILVFNTLDEAIRLGLGNRGRVLCGLPENSDAPPDYSVYQDGLNK